MRCIESAVEKRKAEFSTGRFLAAQALDALDFPRTAITKGENNEPIWPDGIVGSITHSSKFCLVVLARGNTCSGLGIDIENRDAEVRTLSHLILRNDETENAPARNDEAFDDNVRRTFSAKESIFKAVYPQVNRFVDFTEVRLRFDTAQQTFSAQAPENNPLDRLLGSGQGGYIDFEDIITTGFYLPGA